MPDAFKNQPVIKPWSASAGLYSAAQGALLLLLSGWLAFGSSQGFAGTRASASETGSGYRQSPTTYYDYEFEDDVYEKYDDGYDYPDSLSAYTTESARPVQPTARPAIRPLVRPPVRPSVNPPPDRRQTNPAFSDDSLCLVIGGRKYTSQYRTEIPSMSQVYRVACFDRAAASRRSICPYWPAAKRSFEAAGKALGIPASALVCLMKAETNLVSGLTSNVGARGLMQFMPGTARHFATLMNQSPSYQSAWNTYRENQGTRRGASEFTARNITSPQMDMADVQIFAAAMYFRDSLRGTEGYWKQALGSQGAANPSSMRSLFHFLLVSYNVGPAVGQSYIRYGGRMRLPYETVNYLHKFDACMNQAARN